MKITKDELFEMLEAAYLRGAHWWQDNASPEYLGKAARDYADANTSQLPE